MEPDRKRRQEYWLGISPKGIGTIGMLLNFAVATIVSRMTAEPPPEIQDTPQDA